MSLRLIEEAKTISIRARIGFEYMQLTCCGILDKRAIPDGTSTTQATSERIIDDCRVYIKMTEKRYNSRSIDQVLNLCLSTWQAPVQDYISTATIDFRDCLRMTRMGSFSNVYIAIKRILFRGFYSRASSTLWRMKSFLVMESASFHHSELNVQMCTNWRMILVHLSSYSPDPEPSRRVSISGLAAQIFHET